MNKEKISPMSEATLWRLYRRLLAEHLLRQRLPPSPSLSKSNGSGIAAALTENLIEGDSLGLAPGDLVTRYLCGMPLEQIRAAAVPRPGRRKQGSWALDGDAAQGLLPCAGEEQAMLAVGTALAAHLNHSGSVTVLYESSLVSARKRQPEPGIPAWTHAAQMAAALHLPLLFVASIPFAPPSGPRKPPPAMPSIPVDRCDALALYRVIYECLARARTGGGPAWIECCAWPLPPGPAEQGPAAQGVASDPVAPTKPAALMNMEQALRSRKLFDRHQQRQVQSALEKEFAHAAWPLYADT